jgi:hypothetical protein
MCGWSVVLYRNNESTCKSPSILSLQMFATGPTCLTFNQTHYERNDFIGWIAFEVCNAKTYELFMSTNVYKRFDPRVMEREERIGINRGLPTMVSTVHRVDSLAHMLIVFDSKSSLTHYTFDKIKILSQIHICIILLYLIFYFSKFLFKSWLVAHESWVSVGSFLVPGNCKNAEFCTIYPPPDI